MKKSISIKTLVTASMLFIVCIASTACSSKKATSNTYAEGKAYTDEDPNEKIKVKEKNAKMPFDTTNTSPQMKLSPSYPTE